MMPPLPFPFRRFLSAALIAAGAVFLPLAAGAVPVRIASFNICNASGAEKLAAISNILQRVRPDILALEEATTGQEAAYTTLFASLGNPLPHHVFMPNPGSGRGTQSDKLAIYSRWPIVSSTIVKETDADPDAVEFMRWPLHAVVEVEGALNPLHVIALHAAASTVSTPRRIWRGLETERVSSFIERHILAADPNATEYVVLGDFNDSADGRWGADNAADFQPASFSYETFRKYETNGTFSAPFRLGSDAAWHSNNASRASHTMLYRTYPNERLGDMSAVTAYRTGSDGDWTTCLDGDVYRLDYILFSDEIAHSSYGAPEGEAYYSPGDREYDLGLDKPGDFAAVDPAASTNASDHLLLFADFHMIDEIGGITPVAILSEVVHSATNPSATFIEICNTGADELDLDGYTLELYLNGAAKYSYRKSFSDVVLDAGGTYWIAGNKTSASNVWGRVPDATWTSLKSLDGNDTVVLRNPSGAIQDIYGAVGVDGASQAWYHEDTAAVRRAGVTDPRSIWDPAEWDLRPSAEATPGEHQALLEADVTLSTPQIHAFGRDSTAPTAAEAFSFTVTATPNTLASNLAASAVFRINGGIWLTNAMTLADPDGTLWRSDALDVARGGGSVADFFVTVSFDGPGDLSPAGSAVQTYTFPGASSATELTDVLLNEVKTAGSGAFAELAGGAGVDVSGWSLALFDTNAQALWTYRIPAGTTVPNDNVRDMWGNAAGFLVLAGDAGVPGADLVLAGCDDGGSLFSATEPRVLVLANDAGGVVDAVAWIATNEFESIVMPDALSTSVPRGAGNFLHCLGVPATGGNSLQAPDNVRTGTGSESVYAMPEWDSAPATPGAANVSQTDGALVIARVDRDADGLLDDEDNCPTAFNPAQSDIDDDGIGDDCDADMDGDGIPNAIDNCPTEPNPLQEDFDADGIGNVCDPEFDEVETSGRYETLHVTFESLAAGASGTFEEGGRHWRMGGAVAGADDADCKLAEKAMRAAPGAILELDGVLTNRLSVVGFFFGPYDGATGTPDVAIELTEDGSEWREYARVATAGAMELTRAVVALDGAPAGARFRLRVLGSGSSPCLDLDNILLVSLVRQTAVVTLDSPLVVAYDGAVHVNGFTVLPADAAWQATYRSEEGEETAGPVEVGTYTASVAVEDADNVAGGTFTFPHSLTILETVPDPEIISCSAEAGAVAATLHAVVKPNRADGEGLLATFEYGTGTNFGSKVVADGSPVGGLAETGISAAIPGLSPNTLYYWRANVGDVSGATRSFATATLSAPGVEATEVRATGFTLSWPALQGAADYLLDVRLGEATATEIAERFWNWSSSASAGTTPTAVEGEGGTWSIVNASVYMGDESGIGSSNVVYLRNKSNSWWSGGTGTYGSLDTPAWEGIGEISFVVRRASGTGGNASGTLKLQRSDDGGSTWTDLATYSVARTVSSNRYAFAAVPANAVKLRFCNTGSYGIYVHDVFATLEGGAASVAGFPAACTDNTCRVTGLAPETTYAVLAKVEYPGGVDSAWSDAIAVTTVTRPAPPVLAAAAAGTSLAFSWNAVAGADSYLLQLAPDADFAPAVARFAESFEGNATNADNTVTTSNGWQAAVSGANCGINTSATTGMTGTGNRIRWTKTSTATATLAIPVPDGATARIASLDWWAASNAPGGTALFWGTSAETCTNPASDFTEATGTGSWETRNGIELGPVPGGTLFLAFAKTGTDSVFGIDNIVLETSESVRAIETAETTATVEHLPARTTYFARVSADGGETWSGTVEAETGDEALPVPGAPELSVGEETSDGFTVSWEPVEDATSYKLEWSRDETFPGTPGSVHAGFEEGIPEGWTVGHTSGTTDPTVVSNATYAAEGTTNVLRLTGAGRYIQTPLLAAPETLSFHYCVPNAGDWALAVQVAETEDFANPVTVDTLEESGTVPAATRYEVELGAYSNVFVRLLDTRPEGTKYRFLDEISVTQKAEGEVFRAETEETSYAIGGLGSGETWFVRAAAANVFATGTWSEVASARTLVTTAALIVTLDPPEALWSFLGTNHASGETVEGLDAGGYEISFLPCDGYHTPTPLAVTLAAGATETLQVAYEKTIFLDAPVLSVGAETHAGFTVSWDAVPDATRYDLEWSRFSSFAGKGEDLFCDFEDGTLPSGWSAAHTNGRYWAWSVVSNAHTAAAGMGQAFRFDHSEAGAYLALPPIPSPGALQYRYCVPDNRPWELAVQVAHDEAFADAITVDVLSTTGQVSTAELHTVDLSAHTNVFVRLLDQRTTARTDPRYVDGIAVTAREGTEVFSATVAVSPYAFDGLASGETWFVRAAAANASVTSAWSGTASAQTVPFPAGITVTLDPPEATWFLLGEEHASGETAGGLEAGEYEISFGAVHGWETPEPATVTLAAGETNDFHFAYEASPAGLTVTLDPAEATWTLLAEEHASGETVGGLDAGEYEISFGAVHGWETPEPATVTLVAGETNEFRFAYEASPAGVTVTLDPPEALWTLLGTDYASGETAGGLDAGEYEITFSLLDGYDTPAPLALTLVAGETNEFAVAYETTTFLASPVLSVGGETTDGFTVSWDAVPNAVSYGLEWSRFDSFAGKGEDLFCDFEDGNLPTGWSAAHTNGHYWAWSVVSNAHTAAAGMGQAFRFDHSEAGAYLASALLPSPGALQYRYCVPDNRPWELAVQVAHDETFSDALTVDVLSTTGRVSTAESHTVDLSAHTNVFVRILDQRSTSRTDPRYVDAIVVTAREGTEVFSAATAATNQTLSGLGSGETWFVRAVAANASVTSAWSAVGSGTTRTGTMTDYERWAAAAGIADLWGTNAEGMAYAEEYLRWTNGLDTLHAATGDGAYEVLVPTNEHGIAVDIEVADELPGENVWRAPTADELSPAGGNRYDVHPTNDPASLFLRLRLSPAE